MAWLGYSYGCCSELELNRKEEQDQTTHYNNWTWRQGRHGEEKKIVIAITMPCRTVLRRHRHRHHTTEAQQNNRHTIKSCFIKSIVMVMQTRAGQAKACRCRKPLFYTWYCYRAGCNKRNQIARVPWPLHKKWQAYIVVCWVLWKVSGVE